jgi:alpha-L-fucosidase
MAQALTGTAHGVDLDVDQPAYREETRPMAAQDLPKLDVSALPAPVDVSDNRKALAEVSAVVAAGPYSAGWGSLQRYTPPLWYQDAKLGIFVHWGIYSVPAYENEWYTRSMYQEDSTAFAHHVAAYGPQNEFGYKDFIPSFRMERFDPQDWVALFRRAGAQYVVPVAEHHDGFAMYDSDRSRWTAAKLGPCRDVLGDLLDAVDEAWMVRGASSHRAEHWFFMNGGMRFDSDVRDPALQDLYGPAQRVETAPNERFLEDWLLRCVEVVDRYRPQIVYFDWWIEQPAFEPYLRTFAAYYYNRAAEWGREVVIHYKWDAFAPGSAVYDIERGSVSGIRKELWQNDTAVSRSSWCWVEDHVYKRSRDIVAELADVVARNGVLQLNVGPKPDGTIPDEERRILEELGVWLVRNGEAIYGTRPWTVAAEGPTRVAAGSFTDGAPTDFGPTDIRFTRRTDATGDYVYAILLAEPSDRVARVRSFAGTSELLERGVRSVSVLGSTADVAWERTADSLDVVLPDALVSEHGGPVVRLFLDPEPQQVRTDAVQG